MGIGWAGEKGIYDRLLAAFNGPACGVAFEQQIVSRVPNRSP